MKPNEPPGKIRFPREFADRGRRSGPAIAGDTAVAEPEGEPVMPESSGALPVSGTHCPLCREGMLLDEGLITLESYPTGQRDLLTAMLAASHSGIDLRGEFHGACLERFERELQAAQIVRDDGRLHFIDLMLGPIPILPTPVRMSADGRFAGRGVCMAFVDSGFYPHPDLMEPAGRILALYDAVEGREVGNIRRMIGRRPSVRAWHGTMAAAAAAGSGFCSGGTYRGIASAARLVLVRAMTRHFRIRTPQVVRALQWIAANRERYDIRVVNLSLGVDETTDSLEHPVIALVEELSASGVVVVAASGNNPANPIRPPGAAPSAITVGGYNDHNSMTWLRRELWHGSYGSTPGGGRKPELLGPAIWVAAPILPGTEVSEEADALFQLAGAEDDELMRLIPALAGRTAVGGRLLAAARPVYARSIVFARIAAEKLITSDYKHVDGTSFAAPIVSSVVAQMLEARPGLKPAEVKEILTATAISLPGVPGDMQGHGLVAPERALAATLRIHQPGIIT